MALTMGKDHISFVLGDVKRVLPVREVKPGVRVALFNPLGGMYYSQHRTYANHNHRTFIQELYMCAFLHTPN